MKQTAMQMAIDHYKKLSEQGSNQAYVVAKFLEENFLAMEKEQIVDAYLKDRRGKFDKALRLIYDAQKYYTETYESKTNL